MVSRQEGTGFIAQEEIVFNKLTNSPSTKQMRKQKVYTWKQVGGKRGGGSMVKLFSLYLFPQQERKQDHGPSVQMGLCLIFIQHFVYD